MEEQVSRLVEKVWGKYESCDPSHRILIAISGIPGSGKTTLARSVTERLNARVSTSEALIAKFVPMDGYHLTRAQLSSMPDPQRAHDRRGAEFTFDGDAFLRLVQKIRKPSPTDDIFAPSFDHAIKDPIVDDICITTSDRIIIFEGNYLSLNKSPWNEAAKLMDELWFVEVDFEVAGKRLVGRHVASGIAADEESAWKRIRQNDLKNGSELVRNRLDVDEVVKSVEDAAF